MRGKSIGLLLLGLTGCQPLQPVPPSASPTPSRSAQASSSPSPTPSASSVTVSPTPVPSPSGPFPSPPRPTGYPVEVVAGSGQKGFQDGPALQATFNAPTKPCFNPRTNTLYIPDTNMLRKLTTDGQVLTVAGGQEPGYQEGPAQEARFNFLTACAVDAEGNVLLTDAGNQRIRKLAPTGQVTTLVGTGERVFRDGDIKQAAFGGGLTDMTLSGSGDLYLADSFRVCRFAQERLTTLNATQNSEASREFLTDGPIATVPLLFGSTLYLAADTSGNLYIADRHLIALRRVDAQGIVKTLSLTETEAIEFYKEANGILTKDIYLHIFAGPPVAVTFDSARNKAYASAPGSSIFQVEPDGKMTMIVGNYLLAEGSNLFNLVARGGLSIGKDHHLYVIDQGAYQIKRVLLPPP